MLTQEHENPARPGHCLIQSTLITRTNDFTKDTCNKMSHYQLDDGRLRLTICDEAGQAMVQLTDLQSGATWGPSRAFVMEAMSRLLQGTEPVDKPPTEISQGSDWIEVRSTVDSPYVSVGATVRFALEAGELVARIPTDKIREPRSQVSLLDGIVLLPGFMSVTTQQPGHLVLPLRQGALCYPERHAIKRLIC